MGSVVIKKRSRKIISDDEENYKPRKQLKTSIKSEEILLIVKIFKQDIISYNKTINRIENSLDNQEEFIYDECSEHKTNIAPRLICSNTENTIFATN